MSRKVMSRRRFVQAGMATTAVGLAGCGSSSDSTPTPQQRTEETTTEANTVTGTGSDTPPSVAPTFQTKLVPEDVEPDNQLFGTSVALSDDIILVGFPKGPNENSEAAGNVYVFDKSDGELNQQAILTADDGTPGDDFGISVALADDAGVALIGTIEGNSAHVFERSGDSWSQQAKLAPSDGDEVNGFGVSVALADDASTALIGHYRDDDPNGWYGGSAYVFERAGNEWVQQAKLAADDGDSGGTFGISVSLSDGLALVGASHYQDQNGGEGGSTYVFERTESGWTQQTKLTADDGLEKNKFGETLVLKGETAFIGASAAVNANSDRAGAVYIFDRVDGRWSQQTKLTGDAGDGLGRSIDLSNDLAIFGAFADREWTGSAYVYQRREEVWTQQAKLTAQDGDSEDWFGRAVAIDSDTAIVGANRDEDPNGREGGAAYVFTL